MRNAKFKNGRGCHHFWNAIRKYGKGAFTHHILGVCHSVEDANLVEEIWIFLLDTQNPEKGFNLAKGGGHVPAVNDFLNDPEYRARHKAACNTPESKVRSSETAKHQMEDPERRYFLRTFRPDPRPTEEMRSKISDASRSRIITNETREKLSRAGIGRKLSLEHAVKLREMGAIQFARLKARVHCKHGHSLSDAYIRKSDNERICKTCVSIRSKRRWARKKEANSHTKMGDGQF